jgi:hypothetical protein
MDSGRSHRLSPGTVLGGLALVISLCGIGVAAIQDSNGVLHACYAKKGGDVRLVKANKKCAKNEKATSWSQKGATGPQGQRGATGPVGVAGTNGANGIDGSPGQAGSAGPGLLFGTLTVTDNQTTFTSLAGANTTTQSDSFTQIPPGATLTARDFSARVRTVIPATESVSVALQVNGVDSPLACTINAGQNSCAPAGSPTVQLPPGTNVNWRYTASNGAGNNQANVIARIVF